MCIHHLAVLLAFSGLHFCSFFIQSFLPCKYPNYNLLQTSCNHKENERFYGSSITGVNRAIATCLIMELFYVLVCKSEHINPLILAKSQKNYYISSSGFHIKNKGDSDI